MRDGLASQILALNEAGDSMAGLMEIDEKKLKELIKQGVVEVTAERQMTETDKIENAKDIRFTTQQAMLWAEQRNAALSDEYIRLEVQIATIIFAFASLALTEFSSGTLQTSIDGGQLDLMKLAFALSMFSLMTSLVFGLLHLKMNEGFWDGILTKRVLRYEKWDDVTKKRTSYEEAEAFQQGTRLGGGSVGMVPNWTWMLQTICLASAIVILFVLGVIFVFHQR